jgi:hypothetical protein
MFNKKAIPTAIAKATDKLTIFNLAFEIRGAYW